MGRVATIVATWVIVLYGCNGGSAERRSPDDGAKLPPLKASEQLCLSVELPRETVALGDPALAVVVLRNCGDTAARVRDLLAPDCGLLQLEVEGPSDEVRPWRSPVYRNCRGRQYLTLEPGETHAERLPLYFAKGGWFLREPGRYRIRAIYPQDAGGRVASQPTNLEVTEPTGSEERSAAFQLMDSAAGRALYLGGGKVPSRELEEFARANPDTSPGRFAELALALHAARRGECGLALPTLENAAKTSRDPLYAADAASAAAGCLRASGDDRAADRLLDAFRRSHAESTWQFLSDG